jgi:hypothetical protein
MRHREPGELLALFDGRERAEEQLRRLLARTELEPVGIEERLIEAQCR